MTFACSIENTIFFRMQSHTQQASKQILIEKQLFQLNAETRKKNYYLREDKEKNEKVSAKILHVIDTMS